MRVNSLEKARIVLVWANRSCFLAYGWRVRLIHPLMRETALINDEQRKRHARDSLWLMLAAVGLFCALALFLPLVLPTVGGFSFLRFPIGLFLTAIGTIFGIIFVIFWAAERQDKLDRSHGLTSEF
jgi:putative solute:sodium symporter small subunit